MAHNINLALLQMRAGTDPDENLARTIEVIETAAR